MARYIKREMVDLNNPGQTIFTYRMQTMPMDNADFIEDCARNTTFSGPEIMGILSLVADQLAKRMARGYSVTIDGLGTFKAQIGLTRDARKRLKEETSSPTTDESDDSTQSSLNARSLEVTGILWKPAKSLVRDTNCECRLERGGEEPLRKSKYTLEERRARALAYLEKHTVMRVSDYVRLTGLSHTKAAKELNNIPGVKSEGSRSSKVFFAE